jgi:FkbM family methyltransferase
MFNKPMGGTELMYEELMKRLPQFYKDRYSIFNYLPQADFSKTTVYWNQLSYDQEAVQALANPELIEKIDHFVYVSNWQAEKFRQVFGVPGFKTEVIKNACIGVDTRQAGPKEKVKLCYVSTPWRGLDVLLDAWEILKPDNCELHVFSSCKIYGEEFANQSENLYQPLYDKCLQLPGVVYRGSIPNEDLRRELPSFDILAYPNTFEETSCIAVIEALSAGLRVVCSNLGALPETTEGFARIYPYLVDKKLHAEKFASILSYEIDYALKNKAASLLNLQVSSYKPRWSWENRIYDWINFLNKIVQDQINLDFQNLWDRQIFDEVYIGNEYGISTFEPDDVVLDLGCHIGSFSRLAYDNGSRKIIAFEANPDIYYRSKSRLPSEIEVINKAVWRSDEEPKVLKFDVNVVDGNGSMGKVFEGGEIEVESIRLDDVLEKHETVRLIKIDVEGSEYEILFTSKKLERVKVITGEFHEYPTTKQINGYSLDRKGLQRYFEDLGWKIDVKESDWSKECGFFKAFNLNF